MLETTLSDSYTLFHLKLTITSEIRSLIFPILQMKKPMLRITTLPKVTHLVMDVWGLKLVSLTPEPILIKIVHALSH